MNLLCTASISDPGRAWRRFGPLPTIFIDHLERDERNDGDKTDHPVPGHLPRGMGSSLAPCGKRLGVDGVEGSSSLVNNNQRRRLTELRRQGEWTEGVRGRKFNNSWKRKSMLPVPTLLVFKSKSIEIDKSFGKITWWKNTTKVFHGRLGKYWPFPGLHYWVPPCPSTLPEHITSHQQPIRTSTRVTN